MANQRENQPGQGRQGQKPGQFDQNPGQKQHGQNPSQGSGQGRQGEMGQGRQGGQGKRDEWSDRPLNPTAGEGGPGRHMEDEDRDNRGAERSSGGSGGVK